MALQALLGTVGGAQCKAWQAAISARGSAAGRTVLLCNGADAMECGICRCRCRSRSRGYDQRADSCACCSPCCVKMALKVSLLISWPSLAVLSAR